MSVVLGVTVPTAADLDDAEEQLYKALDAQRTGEAHHGGFADPTTEALADKLRTEHRRVYDQMLREITDLLMQEGSA